MRMPPPRFTCWMCTFTSSTQTALTTHLRRTHSIRLNPPHRPRYGNPGALASMPAAGRYPFGMRGAGPAMVGLVGGDLAASEGSPSAMAKSYCLPGYICQVCRFRSPTGAGLARHAYSHHQKTAPSGPMVPVAQMRPAVYTQGLSSVVVREVATNSGGNMRPMLQAPELQHLSTTSASSQSLYSTDSIRVGVPLDSPVLSSEEQHEMQGQGQVQDQQPMTDAALDQTTSIAPIGNESCPDCGCTASGKCGQRTPEPGRILLVSQENLTDVTDPTRPQELYELGADTLQPLGGLDPSYIEHVHCEEGMLELHYKPPNATKTVHLTAVRVQQLTSTQDNDMNEQSGGVEGNIASAAGGADQQEEALSAVKKSELQIGDHSVAEMVNDAAGEACFHPEIPKEGGDEVDGEDSILQEQMETGENGSAAAGDPTEAPVTAEDSEQTL